MKLIPLRGEGRVSGRRLQADGGSVCENLGGVGHDGALPGAAKAGKGTAGFKEQIADG